MARGLRWPSPRPPPGSSTRPGPATSSAWCSPWPSPAGCHSSTPRTSPHEPPPAWSRAPPSGASPRPPSPCRVGSELLSAIVARDAGGDRERQDPAATDPAVERIFAGADPLSDPAPPDNRLPSSRQRGRQRRRDAEDGLAVTCWVFGGDDRVRRRLASGLVTAALGAHRPPTRGPGREVAHLRGRLAIPVPEPLVPAAGAVPGTAPSYWLTRAVFLRALGAIYLVAFLSLARQLVPLIGSHGLLPATGYLSAMRAEAGSALAAFTAQPGIFWLAASDRVMVVAAWAGVAASLVVLAGFADALLLGALWLLYLSFVHIGQTFYGFGWEILLLETGFLGTFLCPLVRGEPFPARTPPPLIVLVLLRWLACRAMLGAGLIKMRGAPCWRALPCLFYHYETQPLPNPLSWLLHQTPPWF